MGGAPSPRGRTAPWRSLPPTAICTGSQRVRPKVPSALTTRCHSDRTSARALLPRPRFWVPGPISVEADGAVSDGRMLPKNRGIGRERRIPLHDSGVDALDNVGGANDGADLGVEGQERHELRPRLLPQPHDRWISVAPGFVNSTKRPRWARCRPAADFGDDVPVPGQHHNASADPATAGQRCHGLHCRVAAINGCR